MTLDYSTDGEVKVDMVDYVKEMVRPTWKVDLSTGGVC